MRQLLTVLSVALILTAAATAQVHTCQFTSYGKSCGPVLTGKSVKNGNTNFVTMTLTKAQPATRVLILISAVKLDIDLRPIFGGTLNCRLFVRLDFLQQHRTNAAGTYVWGHALPSTHAGVAYAQVAELRTDGTVLTSNGLELLCK